MKLTINIRNAFILIVIISLPKIGQAQSPREFERTAKKLMSRIDDLFCCEHANDSLLEIANGNLYEFLDTTLSKIPQSISMKMHIEGLWVATSADHKLRSWAWNTYMGGSMPQISELVEFETPKGIQVVDPFANVEGGNDGTWIYKIRTVHTKSGHTCYLVISGSQGDGRHVGEQVDTYEIQGTKLNMNVPIFQTKKGLLSEISYSSDPTISNVHNQFKFSADGRTFLVPLGYLKDKENYSVRLTKKSLRYVFDGEHFVYQGVTRSVKE
jgi:hypothetical protein